MKELYGLRNSGGLNFKILFKYICFMVFVDLLYVRIFCIKSFLSVMKKRGYIVFDMKDINFDVK